MISSGVFAAAFGFVEAVVEVYLRAAAGLDWKKLTAEQQGALVRLYALQSTGTVIVISDEEWGRLVPLWNSLPDWVKVDAPDNVYLIQAARAIVAQYLLEAETHAGL